MAVLWISGVQPPVPTSQPLLLISAGLLVGVGTRMGSSPLIGVNEVITGSPYGCGKQPHVMIYVFFCSRTCNGVADNRSVTPR
jgi:hypothetical protein